MSDLADNVKKKNSIVFSNSLLGFIQLYETTMDVYAILISSYYNDSFCDR